jgi:tRNA threonylcarbamoyladenosine biosynthesis protein TsaB
MTTILALETSRTLCSVVLQTRAERIEDTRKVERLHNEVVLGMINEVCNRGGAAKNTIEVVAFGAGPGSFTGVRIAAAVAQGIAFGADARIVAVPSSRAMAHAVAERLTEQTPGIITMTRSRRDAYYLAGYAMDNGVPELVVGDVLCTQWPNTLMRPDWVAVGDQPPWWGTGEVADDAPIRWGGAIDPTAHVILELGLAAYAAGTAVAPAAGLPIYVQGDSPWIPMDVADNQSESP